MWDALRGLFGRGGRLPSRRELGPYPLIVPLDWILIGPQGEAESIPRLEGAEVHRILIRGALLATEGGHRAIAEKDCVLVQQVSNTGPVMESRLQRYADDKTADLRRAGHEAVVQDVRVLTASPLSEEPVGKVVLFRAEERRTDIHYILRHGQAKWLINYLLRDPNTAAWQSAFAEMDGAVPSTR